MSRFGIGGSLRGRVIEVYGPESPVKPRLLCTPLRGRPGRPGGSGSSTLSTRSIVYARALGVDTDSLLVSQPDTGEQARNC